MRYAGATGAVHHVSQSGESSDDSENDFDLGKARSRCSRRRHKMCSGMYDKPNVKTHLTLRWPQMNLRFGFIEEPLKFKQLRYEHLVVGEIATICQC